MSVTQMQHLLLPAAAGSFAIVYSTITGMLEMSKIRYGKKDEFEHPYKPWQVKDEKGFRAYKAFANQMEWTALTLPSVWTFTLYTPAIPVIGNFGPAAGFVLSLAYAYFNKQYAPAYIESAEARIAPFQARTLIFRIIVYTSVVAMCFSAYEMFAGKPLF